MRAHCGYGTLNFMPAVGNCLSIMVNKCTSKVALRNFNRLSQDVHKGNKLEKSPPNPLLKTYTVFSDTSFVQIHLAGQYTVKKRFAIYPSPAGKSLTKPSLVGNNLMNPGQGVFS